MFRDKYKNYWLWGVTSFSVVIASILFFFFIFRLDSFGNLIHTIMGILKPIIYGLVLAYLLGPIASFWQKKAIKLLDKSIKNKKRLYSISKASGIVIALLVGLAVIGGLVGLVGPSLSDSITKLKLSIPEYVNQITAWFDLLVERYPQILTAYNEIYQKIVIYIENWIQNDFAAQINTILGSISGGVVGGVVNIFSFLLNALIGIIVSIYVLNGKERFVGQGKKIAYALLRPKAANNVITIIRQSNKIFGGFISGKLIDSLIIGIICAIGLYCMNMPYTALVSVIVGVTNVIPFFGPYIGAIPSAILILLTNPIKCIYFIIFIIILQQVDGNIIGPKILGSSTGLSAFWVVFAILLGGGLFGFVGMIIGVPTFAVIYYIIKTFIEWRLSSKKLPKESMDYWKVDYIDTENGEIRYQNQYEIEEETKEKKIKEKKEEENAAK